MSGTGNIRKWEPTVPSFNVCQLGPTFFVQRSANALHSTLVKEIPCFNRPYAMPQPYAFYCNRAWNIDGSVNVTPRISTASSHAEGGPQVRPRHGGELTLEVFTLREITI
jgi:hypothetical protein